MRTKVLWSALALALIAAGCGGGAGGAEPAADETPSREDQALRFSECLREHGVEISDPGGSDGPRFGVRIEGDIDPHSDEFRAAMEACREFSPFAGGEGGPGALRGGLGGLSPDDPETQEALLRFAECMREQGIDMPDPTSEGIRITPEIAGGARRKLQEAMEMCRPILSEAVEDSDG